MKLVKRNSRENSVFLNKNVSDCILDFLKSKDVTEVFVLTGGAIAFTLDAFSGRKDISYICVQHEQAAAMMADAYARLKGNFAATMSTSGPGATNLITGIACSYFDSIANIHITGQVNLTEQRNIKTNSFGSRQVGFQETDIVSISKPITKKSIQLKKADKICKTLEKLYCISQSGRPGPVLLDLPMCLQRELVKIDTNKRKNYPNKMRKKSINIQKIINTLLSSKRPIIIAGGGIRYSKSVKLFNKIIKLLNIPVVTTWSGIDTIDHNNKLYLGHIGVYGSRAANFCLQNSDCILSLGSRLDTRITGGKPSTFGRNAKIISVDIDKGELNKNRGLKINTKINEDCNSFLKRVLCYVEENTFHSLVSIDWKKYYLKMKRKYPTVSKDFSTYNNFINPYLFVDQLSKALNKKDVVIPDDGGHLTWFMQAFKLKLGQRVFSAFGNSPMGYSFPASIGASIALNKKRIICIDGDGSFQINMQELQTLVNEKLPIKIFIFNNGGYGIIKQFQSLYLDKRYNASGIGVSAPNYKKIAKAYGIEYRSVKKNCYAKKVIEASLKTKEACLVEVFIHPEQKIIPKLCFGNPIEDLDPKLNRKEFKNNMLYPLITADKEILEAN